MFIDPLLGMNSIFSRIEFLIDNEKIELPNLEEFNFVYQSINRRFTTDEFYREKYGETIPRISTTTDRYAADVASASEPLKQALVSLHMDSWNVTNPVLGTFGMDGNFPISCQSNILAALMKKKVENGFLKPGTRITIRLYKRATVGCLLDTTKAIDTGYYSNTDLSSAPVNIEFDIIDLKLVYESFIPDSKSLANFAKGIPKYYVDVPRFRFAAVPPKQMVTSHELDIPKGTKALIVGWAHSSALWWQDGKNLNTRYKFVPNSKEVKMKMNGEEGFIVKDGLKAFGSDEEFFSTAARLYHSNLVQKGLYDRPFNTMFPRKIATIKSYDQVLILDLTDRTINEDTKMTLTHVYDVNMSPENYYLFYITLQQYLFTHQATNKWKYDVVT
jgi:hypothetical protein